MRPVSDPAPQNFSTTSIEFFRLRNPSFFNQTLLGQESADLVLQAPQQRSESPILDPVLNLTHEASSLRLKLATERRESHHMKPRHSTYQPATNVSFMGRELEYSKDEIARLQLEVVTWEERCGRLEKALQDVRDMLKNREKEVERLRKERDKLLTDRGEAQANGHSPNQKSKRESRMMGKNQGGRQNEGKAPDREAPLPPLPKDEQRHDRNLSMISISSDISREEHRARVQSMETFMTMTDSWSGSQVIQAVQDLNSEVLQFAASAAEICLSDNNPGSTQAKSTLALQETASRLGPNFARFLSLRNHTHDPILVQFALQACVLSCVVRWFSSFCVGLPAKPDAFFAQIYLHMRSGEPQPVSSRWRALTHRYINTLHPALEEQAVGELTELIFQWCANVFIVSRCSPALSSRESLKTRFGPQMRRISLAACRLARVSKEEILSTNFELISVDHGRKFETEDMVDALGEYASSGGKVLCTTELGLRCTTRRKSPDGPEGVLGRRVLLKPKTILESVVHVLTAE